MMASSKTGNQYVDMLIVVEYYLNPGVKRYLDIKWLPAKHSNLNYIFRNKLELSDSELKRQLNMISTRKNKSYKHP